MRKIFASLFLCASLFSLAQDFPGYRAGNYTGVNGVFFNPANIADSRYRWDFNLVSVSTSVGNNQASFSLKDITGSFNTDSLEEKVLGKDAGPSSGLVSVAVQGPSLMFNTGKNGAFALTTRARTMANIIDVEGRLAREIADQIDNAQFPYTLSSSKDMRIAVNAWTEFGLSYGRVLADKEKHFLKGGLSLKFLAGVANGYINMDNLNGTVDEEVATKSTYLANTTGRLAVGFGGVRVSDFDAGNLLNWQSTGFGADLGFVYEFRPEHEQYKLGMGGDWRRDRNKYKARVGVAILDIGRIKYDRDAGRSGAYDVNITGSERFYLRELENMDIDDYNAFFKSRPQYFTPVAGSTTATYNVSLPTTLQVNVDYHVRGGWYVNLEGGLPLVTGEENGHDPRYYSHFMLTPRYEGRGFGVYVPVSHNSLTGLNMGTSLRMGPFFVGSGSLLTAVLGDSKQADVHVGLRFGGLQKDQVSKQRREEKKAARRERKGKS